MRYLGGKMRQSKEIVKAIDALNPNFTTYVEPFCGALWSATAMMKKYPDRKYILNDINPHLICFWEEARRGWNPPKKVSEATYIKYNRERPLGDPMTGYVGFAWSFGGKFFGGAARTNGLIKGSYKSCVDKIRILRSVQVSFECVDYFNLEFKAPAMVYLDPPYNNRTRQSHFGTFDKDQYLKWANRLTNNGFKVIATEFVAPPRWKILHNYGDTVVRHLAAKPPDGTVELLMLVQP